MYAININEIKIFISPTDPHKDRPAKYHFSPLDNFVEAYIDDRAISFQVDSSKPNEETKVIEDYALRMLLRVKFAVNKIENLLDLETGQPIQFELEKVKIAGREYTALPDAVVAVIPNLKELMIGIIKANQLSEEEQKN